MTNPDTRCPICRYHDATLHLYSLLGTAGICIHCYEARAEDHVEIHRAVVEMDRETTPPCFKKAIQEQLRKATCWVSWEEGYLPLEDFYDRMSKQQLVVVPVDPHEEEEQALAREMAQRIIDVQVRPFNIERRLTLWQKVKQWFRSLGAAWVEAVDAGL